MCYNGRMKNKLTFVLALLNLCGWGVSAQPVVLETHESFTFGPGKGKSFHIPLKPEWGALTLRTRMKTTALVPGKDLGWMNGRIPMSFHGKDGKMVGGWPNVFGYEGTRDWTDCVRDYPIPEGAVKLNIGLNHFGTEGTVEFGPLTLSVKRNRALKPCNAPLPPGAPADPWSLDGAWKTTSATRARWSLNGLWGFRPALTNETAETVPGAEDNWGWGKIPAVWDPPGSWGCKGQVVYLSDWFEDHGVTTFAKDRAWYRRDFTMPSEAAGKRVVLTFTMLQTRAAVYVDGARAAEVTFPGGEADITSFVKPGQKQSIALDVTAYPLNPTTLDFNAPDRATEKKSEVKFKGVTGDVYLDVMPKCDFRIAAATVEPDTAHGKITFVADIAAGTAAPHTGGSRSSATARLTARIYDLSNNPVREFTSGELAPDADGRLAFTADWPDAKRWDTHTPGNRYLCRLELWRAAVPAAVAASCDPPALLDAALPFEFGFRDVKIAGRDLLLNGIPIHLRALYNRTINAPAGIACKASALELCRRLKSEGYNYIIAGNYNFSPGSISYMDALLEACDESGVLFSFSLPHVRDYDMKLDRPEVAARYRELTRWAIRRARNHPSVVSYAMNHNCTGYTGDMNPLRIDGVYAPKDTPQRSFRNRHQAQIAARIARALDGTRPIYHHESGNLDDFHTVNIYLNWAPVQERSDWLQHWSETGVKPLFFVEWGMPHVSSWSSYRGPLFIWRCTAYQSLWASEFAAAFRGDAAYEGDTPEVVKALRHEEKLWAAGEPFAWGRLLQPLYGLTNNYYGIQARYMSDNWRSHRAWGITAMLPWDQGGFHRGLGASSASENPARWQNLKAPGIVPDFIYPDGWDTGTGAATGIVRTVVGDTLVRWNAEDCAFIGGDGAFTDKRHHFRPGETVKKTLVILNDRRVPQDVSWTCKLLGNTLRGTVTVPPGGRRDVPVSFALPAKAGTFELSASFTFAGGNVQRDTFTLEAYAPAKAAAVKGLFLYDPKGATAKMFDSLGIAHVRADAEQIAQSLWQNGAPRPSVAVGRGCLTKDVFERLVVPTARGGGRVLVFEQDKAALESVGFRVQAYGLRNAFPRFRDKELGLALDEAMLRDWNGEATLLPPYLDGIPEIEVHYNADSWAGHRNTRVWRCRNRGNVASVIPEKPTIGDWRALCDGGFDLQYAPLLDWTLGDGRVTFCQLDVTDRTVDDPVADDLVNRLVSRLGTSARIWPKKPYAFGQQAYMLARDLGTGFMGEYKGTESGQWSDYVITTGARKPKGFEQKIANGARVVCLGLTAQEVAEWSPVPLAMAPTNGCYASRIENPPPELNGLSNADWSWHGAMDFDAFTEPSPEGNSAFRIVRHGKGYLVFWQVPPWTIDEVKKPYLRTTKRRAQYMLCRLLSNMECNFATPSIRYADVPVAEDDPYRYYRW